MIRWLLLVGVLRHYAWPYVPPELQGMASKGLGAAAILALLVCVWLLAERHRMLLPVMLWWAWEEMQVVVCAASYIVEPWTVEAGQGICSARIGFDLGALGLVAVAFFAIRMLSVNPDRCARNR